MSLCGNCSVLHVGTMMMWNNPPSHFQTLVMQRPDINVSNLSLSKVDKPRVSQDSLGGGPRSWGTSHLFKTVDYLICHAVGWAFQRKRWLPQRSGHWSALLCLIKCQTVPAGWSGEEKKRRVVCGKLKEVAVTALMLCGLTGSWKPVSAPRDSPHLAGCWAELWCDPHDIWARSCGLICAK